MDCNHKHYVVFDETSREHVCTKCGMIIEEHEGSQSVERQKKEEKNSNKKTDTASAYYAAIIPPSGTPYVPPLVKPSALGYVVPVTKLNADYTLTGVLASQIDESNKDAHGNRIANTLDTNRMRFVDKYVVNSAYNADKSLRNAMWIIATLTDKLAISELIKERAAEIYRKAYKQNAVRGRSTKWLAAAALFYACKEHGAFRNPNDFVIALDPGYLYRKDRSGRKDLFMNYKILTSVLDLPIPAVTSPLSELGRIAAIAGISERSIRKAIQIYESLKQFDQTIFYGKSPAAISVCILYIATKYNSEQVKQDVITHSGQISTVTLRKRCDEYINVLKQIDPNLPFSVYAHRNTGNSGGAVVYLHQAEDRDELDVEEEHDTTFSRVPVKIEPGTVRGAVSIEEEIETADV